MNVFSRLSRLLGRLVPRVDDLHVTGDDWRRIGVLLATCAAIAVILTDWQSSASTRLEVGDVAPRTVKAPFTYTWSDQAAYAEARTYAAAAVEPVWREEPLADALITRLGAAFEAGRAGADPDRVREALGVHVPDADLAALKAGDWSADDQRRIEILVRRATSGPIVTDAAALPQRSIAVVGERGERSVAPHEVRTLADARGEARAGLVALGASGPAADAAATVAGALLRGNLVPDPVETEVRARAAANAVQLSLVTVPRGATLFRQGDVLTERDVRAWQALRDARGDHPRSVDALFLGLFQLLLLVSLYQFGSNWLSGFRTGPREVAAAGSLLVLTAILARGTVGASEGIAAMVGHDALATSVWFAVPIAGTVMLVRMLLGTAWTVVFSAAAATLCGLVMGQQALPLVYYLITGVAAGSLVEGTRERISVVRAGISVGLVGAVAALVMHFVQLFALDGEVSLASTIRPAWSTLFAFSGGVLSAFLVLGLIPVFEWAGFVTDYRLMELANLNHPLLRQLMLRAPGSYHHSVMVGTLAEAGCEAIGANALEAKVSAYFHDIGKGLKPAYFIENQRNNVNRHASLDPWRSAQVIISHVVDGGRMAREHKLPKPIVDNIYMHHGTGVLQYFYEEAKKQAAPGEGVDVAAFRYPGPRPSTPEAGVIMLADKVEAATRTIHVPTEENIRAMIRRIFDSVLADGQLDDCPLTVRELSTLAEVFVTVLFGIHHQRIEYAATADLSRAGTSPGPEALITLDGADPPTSRVPPEGAWAELPATDDTSEAVDYESVEHLPHRGSR